MKLGYVWVSTQFVEEIIVKTMEVSVICTELLGKSNAVRDTNKSVSKMILTAHRFVPRNIVWVSLLLLLQPCSTVPECWRGLLLTYFSMHQQAVRHVYKDADYCCCFCNDPGSTQKHSQRAKRHQKDEDIYKTPSSWYKAYLSSSLQYRSWRASSSYLF